MEEGLTRATEGCPQLLELMGWGGNGFRAAEEKKLELKLGLPGGEDWLQAKGRKTGLSIDSTLSLGYSSKVAKSNGSKPCAGAKRVFLGAVEPNTEAIQKQQSLEKKACGPPVAHAAAAGNAAGSNNSSQTRTASTPVVGWPPIRSFRKNIASTSKPSSESQNGVAETATKLKNDKKGLFVKINMDGIPIGRKVDLKAYNSYEKLSLTVDELFRGLIAAQMDPLAAGSQKNSLDKPAITGLLDGSGEYTLVYEDDEGDRMLVGDVPWDMFVSTAKRLRVLKSSDLSASSLRAVSRKRTATQC
ncbi:auxin-responsive protein IAA16-like [Typha angustifolia]|uniref:auxin-responsive protein IAA16-like n=1 Tax=Typha angustifolia TaxID=59011 RepID=UPI003C2BB417